MRADDAECETCDGERSVFEDRFDHATGHYTVDLPCPDCCSNADVVPEFDLSDENSELLDIAVRKR